MRLDISDFDDGVLQKRVDYLKPFLAMIAES